MLRFAFLMNMPGESPETCHGEYNNSESQSRIIGLEKESAAEYVKILADEGFEIVDLCGDFTQSDAENLAQAAGGKIKISHAKYFKAEMEKMETLENLFEYGIIIFMSGVDKTEWLEIINRQGNTYIAFVKDMDSAMEAARELVKKGVAFMELCSWFDAEKTKEIIMATGGTVPIGTCGNIE